MINGFISVPYGTILRCKLMKLIDFNKVRDGRFLKNYELKYINKADKEKSFEIVSYNDYSDVSEIGKKCSGVSIIALSSDHEKMLILKEFRMGVNKEIYNLCAGRLEKDESVEECVKRELMEEAGLTVTKILAILPPSYAAVALSDVMNQIAIVEVSGEPTGKNTSDNEQIFPKMYTKEEARELIKNCQFTSRAQLATYYFSLK